MRDVQVWPPAGELRSHRPRGQKAKIENSRNVTNSVKTLKMVHAKEKKKGKKKLNWKPYCELDFKYFPTSVTKSGQRSSTNSRVPPNAQLWSSYSSPRKETMALWRVASGREETARLLSPVSQGSSEGTQTLGERGFQLSSSDTLSMR